MQSKNLTANAKHTALKKIITRAFIMMFVFATSMVVKGDVAKAEWYVTPVKESNYSPNYVYDESLDLENTTSVNTKLQVDSRRMFPFEGGARLGTRQDYYNYHIRIDNSKIRLQLSLDKWNVTAYSNGYTKYIPLINISDEQARIIRVRSTQGVHDYTSSNRYYYPELKKVLLAIQTNFNNSSYRDNNGYKATSIASQTFSSSDNRYFNIEPPYHTPNVRPLRIAERSFVNISYDNKEIIVNALKEWSGLGSQLSQDTWNKVTLLFMDLANASTTAYIENYQGREDVAIPPLSLKSDIQFDITEEPHTLVYSQAPTCGAQGNLQGCQQCAMHIGNQERTTDTGLSIFDNYMYRTYGYSPASKEALQGIIPPLPHNAANTSNNTAGNLRSGATCQAAAQYWNLCTNGCGAHPLNTSHAYGSVLAHNASNTTNNSSGNLRTAATCTAPAQYWNLCTNGCGVHPLNTSHAYGNALGHDYNSGDTTSKTSLKQNQTCTEPEQYWNQCKRYAQCKTCATQGDYYHTTKERLRHIWDDGTVIKESDVNNNGLVEFVCQHDQSHKETVPKPRDEWNIYLGDRRVKAIYIGDTLLVNAHSGLDTHTFTQKSSSVVPKPKV